MLYSDSTITLSWFKTEPVRWQTFVSNRVSQLHSMLPTTELIHVPSEENPADMCSRGKLSTQLVAQQKFVFEEPSLLVSSFSFQPHTLIKRSQIFDKGNFAQCFVSRLGHFQISKEVNKNTVHLQSNAQERSQDDLSSGGNGSRFNCVGQSDQMMRFEAEYRALSNVKSINPKSSIALLYLLMDNGVIRSAADWPTGTQ